MGLKNMLRRWLEVPEVVPPPQYGAVLENKNEKILIEADKPARVEQLAKSIVPVLNPKQRDAVRGVLDKALQEIDQAKVADALAIAGVLEGHAPLPPRHSPRKIPSKTPIVACVVDPDDPAALLGSLKK